MDVLKSLSKQSTGRRSFLWKAGAAVSAGLAAAVPGMSNHRANKGDGSDSEMKRLSNRLEILEDEKAIRQLHQAYETCLDRGMYEEAVGFFTEDAEAVFNGGVFKGRKAGVSRLHCERFRAGLTGKKIGPAPGFEADSEQPQETIKVSDDGLSASARFSYSIQVGAPIASDSSLVQMARLHGGGIMKWCESGTHEISYAKESNDGGWKIKRLEYRVLSKTDYRPGKAYATAVSVPLLAKTYPEDPAGPDRLVTQA
jgi:hypothetical protein